MFFAFSLVELFEGLALKSGFEIEGGCLGGDRFLRRMGLGWWLWFEWILEFEGDFFLDVEVVAESGEEKKDEEENDSG